jgi:hypothetical protein
LQGFQNKTVEKGPCKGFRIKRLKKVLAWVSEYNGPCKGFRIKRLKKDN